MKRPRRSRRALWGSKGRRGRAIRRAGTRVRLWDLEPRVVNKRGTVVMATANHNQEVLQAMQLQGASV